MRPNACFSQQNIEIQAGALLLFILLTPTPAEAESFLTNTRFVDARIGVGFSETMRRYARGGYELSDGEQIHFRDWYASDWKDLQATFLTSLDEDLGLYWGFSTGESGEKYQIEPSIRIGFLSRFDLSERESLSLSATVVLGGSLKEKPCTADYGVLGSGVSVNCRLAASVLPPEETLKYLFYQEPERVRVSFRYTFRF